MKLFLIKRQDNAINTKAQTRWWWPVFKNMAQVALTPATNYLGAGHAMGIVRLVNDTCFGDRLIETWPSAAAVKLRITLE